jgi:hypothetical protein
VRAMSNTASLYEELTSITTDRIKFEDLKNKLALLAVFTGYKETFLYETNEIKKIKRLSKICRYHNVHTIVTRFSSRPLVRRPRVPDFFIEDFLEFSLKSRVGYQALWVYKDASVVSKIDRSLDSEWNLGILLGYPACCVAEYTENKVRGVEVFFTALKEKAQTREAIKHLLYTDSELQMELPGLNLVDKTISQFPFVFHVACEDCLSGKRTVSLKLNKEYQEVAWNASKHLHDEILNSSLAILR